MKKILIFSLQYYPLVGGAEVAIKEITDRIDPADIEFHMVTLRFDAEALEEERVGNVFVHRVGRGRRGLTYAASFGPAVYLSKIFFVPLALHKARALRRAHRFDALWAMMSYMLFPIVLLRWTGVRVPYLLTLQEGDPFERVFNRPHIALFRPLLTSGFRHASAVQAISTFLGEWAKRAGFPSEPVVIGNGVDLARFSRAVPREEVRAMQDTIGKKAGETWLIHTGRLVYKNALDDVIGALPRLPSAVHFFAIGDGPDKGMLGQLAEELGVASRVHLHAYVSLEELPRYLAACDIFIRPSRSEGMGNSFIEAMAAGLPVVATQEGGIADFLFDAKRNPGKAPTGFAVEKNAPEQIAKKVEYILAHPDAVKVTVENAQELVAERYEWGHITARMKALFLEVCAS